MEEGRSRVERMRLTREVEYYTREYQSGVVQAFQVDLLPMIWD